MKFPCEIIAEPYMTQLRIHASRYLKDHGFTQNEIAGILNISQPVVSSYLSKEKSHDVPEGILLEAQTVGTEIGEILRTLKSKGIPQAIELGCNGCKKLRNGGPTCVYHKAVIPNLEDDCTRCLTKSTFLELQLDNESILRDLRDLFNHFSKISNFKFLIPEIGLQIVMASNDATQIQDIAGFPGRIIKRKDGGPYSEQPAFGSSRTLSSMLLELRQHHSNIRVIAALKTTDWLEERLVEEKIGFQVTENLDSNLIENVLTELSAKEADLAPFILVDKGAVGFEALSYIISTDLSDLRMIFRQLLS